MDSARDPRLYVEDMLGFCNTALGYTQGFDQPSLLADRMRYDATLRNLELIGEACTHVPAEIRALAPGDWHPQPAGPCLTWYRRGHGSGHRGQRTAAPA
jgi:uncharacterized protein with HEPN domain